MTEKHPGQILSVLVDAKVKGPFQRPNAKAQPRHREQSNLMRHNPARSGVGGSALLGGRLLSLAALLGLRLGLN